MLHHPAFNIPLHRVPNQVCTSYSYTLAVLFDLRFTVATEHIDDPAATATNSSQPDTASPKQRSVFHFKDFQNPTKQSLLKRLADISPPKELSQEQKDFLGKINFDDLKNMGIWQSQDLLLIMKKLTMQVKTDEIKNFFVRLQQ